MADVNKNETDACVLFRKRLLYKACLRTVEIGANICVMMYMHFKVANKSTRGFIDCEWVKLLFLRPFSFCTDILFDYLFSSDVLTLFAHICVRSMEKPRVHLLPHFSKVFI